MMKSQKDVFDAKVDVYLYVPFVQQKNRKTAYIKMLDKRQLQGRKRERKQKEPLYDVRAP